jgi:hypothetical protein
MGADSSLKSKKCLQRFFFIKICNIIKKLSGEDPKKGLQLIKILPYGNLKNYGFLKNMGKIAKDRLMRTIWEKLNCPYRQYKLLK